MGAAAFSPLGRIGWSVLPRISAALSEFIAPISSNRRTTVHSSSRPGQSTEGFEKYQPGQKLSKKEGDPQDQKKDQQPGQVIQLDVHRNKPPSPPATEPTTAVKPPGTSVAQTLIQLLAVFQEQRLVLLRWLGSRSYHSAIRTQKRSGVARRGAIFDHRAE